MRRAQQLDPFAHRTDVANALIRAGRYDEAVSEAARAVDFDPEHDRARATLGWAYLKQGRTQEGLAELERAVALSPDNFQWLAQLGQARALTGDEPGARDVLRQLEARARDGFVSPFHLAFVHTGLGEHERALDLLERAVAGHGAVSGSGIVPARTAAQLPRFQALVEPAERSR
jgi:Flp pilus assembly protein TadD